MQIDRLHLTSTDPREQIQQIRTYLFKLAEQLEDAFDTIDETNLSQSLLNKINKGGHDNEQN